MAEHRAQPAQPTAPESGRDAVLLVGAAGFLGRHVARSLVRRGRRVVALLRRPPERPIPGCEMRLFDGADPGPVLPAQDPPAAVVNVATAYGRDGGLAEVIASNLAMPMRLMEAAARQGCRRWIEAGSYFTAAPGLGPLPAYVLSKRQFRDWAALLATAHDVSVRIAELQHLYGPGDRPDKFVPRLLAACRQGGTVPLTPGGQIRDFIHVEDAAEAIAVLLDAPAGAGVEAVPVGTGVGTSILAFAQLAVELTGNRAVLAPGALPYRPDDPMHAVADASALRGLGWTPAYDVRCGLRQTLSTP